MTQVYVRELRGRLRTVAVAFFVSLLLFMCLPSNLSDFQPAIVLLLTAIRNLVVPSGVILIETDLLNPLFLYVNLAFVLSLTVCVPLMLHEAYLFLAPALYEDEKHLFKRYVAPSAVLFVLGVVFGFTVITPAAVRGVLFYYPLVGAAPTLNASSLYSMIFLTSLSTGLCFLICPLLIGLSEVGLISSKSLAGRRPIFYSAMFTIIMFITPDGNMIANLLIFLPMLALIELSIQVMKRREKTL